MSIFFAAARTVAASPVARVLAPRPLPVAANDIDGSGDATGDAILHAALRHFAAHGLGAARAAHAQACSAHDQAERDRWTAICRLLDKRLARDLASKATGATRA